MLARRALFPVLFGGRAAALPVTVVEDTFTAADGTAINGRTPAPTAPAGKTWSALAGTWTIQSNRARCNSTGVVSFAVVDSGRADAALSVDVITIGSEAGFALRMPTNKNGWIVVIQTTRIAIVEGDGSTVVARAAINTTLTSGGTLTATLTGSTISATYQGVTVSYGEATRNQTSGFHGLYQFNNLAVQDNFKVVG